MIIDEKAKAKKLGNHPSRCCEVHDHCYSDSWQQDDCWGILDNPYTEAYSFSCDNAAMKLTCNGKMLWLERQKEIYLQALLVIEI